MRRRETGPQREEAPSRSSARAVPRGLAPLLFAVAVATYLGGYGVARSQNWIVHFTYAEPGASTSVIAAHEVTQGRASGEIGGAAGLVPASIAGRPFASAIWITGFAHAHRVFAPLALIETAAWYACEPSGTPWHGWR